MSTSPVMASPRPIVDRRSRAVHSRAVLVAVALALTTSALTTPQAGAVAPADTITRVAGTGTPAMSGDGGPALSATLNEPRDTAIGPDGSIYLTDTFNNRIRRIDEVTGIITTVAGTGSDVYNGDNIPATQASLKWPHDVTVADDGTLYIADSDHHRVRRVDADTGIITTVLGTGRSGTSGDNGLGTKALLKKPKSVALYGGGLYVADLSNRVRRLDLATGIVTTVAGNGAAGYSGDGGPATLARLNTPQRIAIDSTGSIYIADTGNNRIRRVDGTTGIITTVAGTGVAGFSGDNGQGKAARLKAPRGVTLEGDGTLYIADSGNNRIRKLDLASGVITTIAGSAKGFSGDGGPASAARFTNPRGLTVDAAGRLIVCDTLNSVIRVITPAAPA